MNIRFDYCKTSSITYITTEGELDAESIEEKTLDIVEIVRHNTQAKIILDHRKLKHKQECSEPFCIPRLHETVSTCDIAMIVIVLNHSQFDVDKLNSNQASYAKEGYKFRISHSLEHAEQLLLAV